MRTLPLAGDEDMKVDRIGPQALSPARDSRWIALVILCLGFLMIILDSTIVNVALPSIQHDLGFSQSTLAWVMNAYLIAFGGLLLLAGRFGDLLGRKSLFMAGLTVFTLASLACGAAQSQEMLVAARFVQGVGGAMTSALMLGVYTIVKPAAEYGWGAGRTLGLAAASLALLVAFVVREARAANPLIPLGIFRSRNVSGANVIQALLVAGMFGTFFLGSLYLQRVRHYDALEIGLAFLPATIVMGILSLRYSERFVMRFGPRATLIPGVVLIAVGLGLFTRAPVHGMYVRDVLPAMVLIGFGVGVAFPALMNLAMSGATQEDAGLASGLVNTTMQVGGALGLAVLATLAASPSNHLIPSGHRLASALTRGYHLASLVGLGR